MNSKAQRRLEKERVAFETSPFFFEIIDDRKWNAIIKPQYFKEPLRKVFDEKGLDGIHLAIQIPEEYPMKGPDVRIIRPQLNSPIIFSGALCLEVLSVHG